MSSLERPAGPTDGASVILTVAFSLFVIHATVDALIAPEPETGWVSQRRAEA